MKIKEEISKILNYLTILQNSGNYYTRQKIQMSNQDLEKYLKTGRDILLSHVVRSLAIHPFLDSKDKLNRRVQRGKDKGLVAEYEEFIKDKAKFFGMNPQRK